MDYKNYRLTWRKQQKEELGYGERPAEIPQFRLPIAAQQWDLREGGHPTLLNPGEAFYLRPKLKDVEQPNVSLEFQTRPMGCVHGHNTLADVSFSSLVDVDVNVPIAPILVQDLCGRIIHIGLGPESKSIQAWDLYQADKNMGDEEYPEYPNIHLPSVTFPKNCEHVPEDLEGYDAIGNIFFTKFRTLDVSFDYTAAASGDAENLNAGMYPNPHLFPYKMRLDTFYTDGYKLPQTHMVFARQDVPIPMMTKARDKLLHAWEKRPEGQGYEDFIEAFGGEEAVEKLFEQGVTLIPTFEACNGVNQVGRNFELLDFYPGRAVYGLHEVVAEVPSDLPHGTIVDVLEPGYVTMRRVQPAKVKVSDGSGYMTPNVVDPLAWVPNLKLPHQRTVGDWGKCWIPTHPLHFENPAIWGWDAANGYFMQLSGPLWDPLHYYYACTEEIIRAFQSPLPQNRWWAQVPEEMQDRFYPVQGMKGFDTFDEKQLEERLFAGGLPRTATKRVRFDLRTCEIGYHPLPLQYEYELSPFWFPELHPHNRAIPDCPPEFQDRLCPVIQPRIGTDEFVSTVKSDAEWLTDEGRLTPATGDAIDDYPFLMRYLVENLPEEEIFRLSTGLFLEEIEEEYLDGTPQEIWGDMDGVEDLDRIEAGLFDAVWDMREEQLKLLRLRHTSYQETPALYAYAWFLCVPAMELGRFFKEWQEKQGPAEIGKNEILAGAYVAPVSQKSVADAAVGTPKLEQTGGFENLFKDRAFKPASQAFKDEFKDKK